LATRRQRMQGARRDRLLGQNVHTFSRIRSGQPTHSMRANASRATRHNKRAHRARRLKTAPIGPNVLAPADAPTRPAAGSLPPGAPGRRLDREWGLAIGSGPPDTRPGSVKRPIAIHGSRLPICGAGQTLQRAGSSGPYEKAAAQAPVRRPDTSSGLETPIRVISQRSPALCYGEWARAHPLARTGDGH
jgi:hypothetical protein